MKYEISEIMTLSEASEMYGINLQTLKNKLKPSIAGQEFIDESTQRGIIRKSGSTWLVTADFIEVAFK